MKVNFTNAWQACGKYSSSPPQTQHVTAAINNHSLQNRRGTDTQTRRAGGSLRLLSPQSFSIRNHSYQRPPNVRATPAAGALLAPPFRSHLPRQTMMVVMEVDHFLLPAEPPVPREGGVLGGAAPCWGGQHPAGGLLRHVLIMYEHIASIVVEVKMFAGSVAGSLLLINRLFSGEFNSVVNLIQWCIYFSGEFNVNFGFSLRTDLLSHVVRVVFLFLIICDAYGFYCCGSGGFFRLWRFIVVS